MARIRLSCRDDLGRPSSKLTDSTPHGRDSRRLKDGSRDQLVREEPLRLEIDETRLVTMRTPGQDEDFAAGFLLSEGMVRTLDEVESFEFKKGIPHGEPGPGPGGSGFVADLVRIRLAEDRDRESMPARSLRRVHEMRPSCGLCGIEDLEELLSETNLVPGAPRFSLGDLPARLDAFHERQEVFGATGACHGAAIFDMDGEVRGFGEDVGRHNALDKAIGHAARKGTDFSQCLGMLSGRAGYELVAKLLRVRVPILVSVSAPSALSFDLCREAGATLIGFARGDRAKVYWDDGRLRAD